MLLTAAASSRSGIVNALARACDDSRRDKSGRYIVLDHQSKGVAGANQRLAHGIDLLLIESLAFQKRTYWHVGFTLKRRNRRRSGQAAY